MKLQGKKVIVLGGSSGMGLATAQTAAKEGASVVIASRSKEKLEEAKKTIQGSVEALELDVAHEHKVKAFFDQIGPFDHLISTAAGGPTGNFLELEPADAKRTFDVKYWGQYFSARYGAPYLNQDGSITFCTGVLSRKPSIGTSILSTINGGLEALTRALALELAPIRVNVVSPGIIDTPLYGSMPNDRKEEYFRSVSEALPVPRIGHANEIADAFVFLMTNPYITGTVLAVDGGYPLSSL